LHWPRDDAATASNSCAKNLKMTARAAPEEALHKYHLVDGGDGQSLSCCALIVNAGEFVQGGVWGAE
jgi:hypothetical protein